jgi:cyclophilin family peptidyl-prolyl cis-trans isomerase
MTRQAEYIDSATSQFFINLGDNSSLLDYKESEDDDTFGYCVFGEVVKGLDVMDKIAAVAVHDTDSLPMTPAEPVVISSVERVE